MVPTPRTRFLRPFTTRVINPLTRLVAGRLPGFATVVHVGRKSGRVYRTPVNVFRRGPDYVFALTYGSDVNWVRNVLAAGGCELEVNGRKVRLTDPGIVVDPSRSMMPFPVRQFLGLIRVSEFLLMSRSRLRDDHDVEVARPVDPFDPVELDVARRRGATDPRGRAPALSAPPLCPRLGSGKLCG